MHEKTWAVKCLNGKTNYREEKGKLITRYSWALNLMDSKREKAGDLEIGPRKQDSGLRFPVSFDGENGIYLYFRLAQKTKIAPFAIFVLPDHKKVCKHPRQIRVGRSVCDRHASVRQWLESRQETQARAKGRK